MNQETEKLRHREVYQCDMYGGTNVIYFDRLFHNRPNAMVRNPETKGLELYTFGEHFFIGDVLHLKETEKIRNQEMQGIIEPLERIASKKGI